MFESFEYEGSWWFPENPEARIRGTLKFDPLRGAVLEIESEDSYQFENFIKKTIKEDKEDKQGKLSIILGESLKPAYGIKFTLLECKIIYFESIDAISSKIYAGYILSNAHFESLSEIKFRDVYVQYEHLYEWANLRSIEVCDYPNKQRIITLKKPETVELKISDNLNLLITLERVEKYTIKEVTVKEEAGIKIVPNKDESFKEYYLDIIDKLEKFLAFVVDRPSRPIDIKGETELWKEIINGKTYYIPVHIYYRLSTSPRSLQDTNPSRCISPNEMLFTRKDISNEKLGAILKNWFESYDLLKPVYDLYFKVFYGLIQGTEWQFLALVQAIEAYHQRKVDPSCSSNFTLRDRLRSVYSDYGDILTSLEIERDKLINEIIYTRNYLIHYNPNFSVEISNQKLYLYISILKLWLQLIFLDETVKDVDQQINKVHKIREYFPSVENYLNRKIEDINYIFNRL